MTAEGRRVPVDLELENCTLVPRTCTLVQVGFERLDESQSGYCADFVEQDINAEWLAEKTHCTRRENPPLGSFVGVSRNEEGGGIDPSLSELLLEFESAHTR